MLQYGSSVICMDDTNAYNFGQITMLRGWFFGPYLIVSMFLR